LLFTSGNLTTTGGVGRVTWTLSQSWFTPLVTPCEGSLFLGITLAPAPTWSSDGQSVFSAYYYPPATRNVGDNPRKNAPNHAWYVQNGVALQASTPASLRMSLFVLGPVLNMGGIDPGNVKQIGSCYGAGGMYPDVGGSPRVDGLDARIRDSGHFLGVAQLFLSAGYWGVPGGISLPSVVGHVWIDPPTLIPLAWGNLLAGTITLPVVFAGKLPSSLIGTKLYFQAATVDSAFTTAVLTNAAVVSY
jgi:hypothetical protein